MGTHTLRLSLFLSISLLGSPISVLAMSGGKSKNPQAKLERVKTTFFDAVKRGNFGLTKRMLNISKKLVNIRDEYGSTPLHWAASRGHDYICELLLANKANPNAKNDEGKTSLHFAALMGKVDTAELLVDNGASIWKTDNQDNLALHLAAIPGPTNGLIGLVGHYKLINARNFKGRTPLLNFLRMHECGVVHHKGSPERRRKKSKRFSTNQMIDVFDQLKSVGDPDPSIRDNQRHDAFAYINFMQRNHGLPRRDTNKLTKKLISYSSP